jgi:hypothetical protein
VSSDDKWMGKIYDLSLLPEKRGEAVNGEVDVHLI